MLAILAVALLMLWMALLVVGASLGGLLHLLLLAAAVLLVYELRVRRIV